MKKLALTFFLFCFAFLNAQENCKTFYHGVQNSTITCEFDNKIDLLIVMNCDLSKILDIKYFTFHSEFLEVIHKDSLRTSNLPPFTYIARTSNDSIWYSVLDSTVSYANRNDGKFLVDTVTVKDYSVINESSIKFYKGLPRRINHSLLSQDSSKIEMKRENRNGSEILFYHISDVDSVCIQDNFLIKERTVWKNGKVKKPKLKFEPSGKIKQLPNSR